MNCREAQSMIVPFIQNKLSEEQSEEFISHIEHCSECYDELEVYFIVEFATRQLDDQSEMQEISDFRSALKKYISDRKKEDNVRRNRRTKKIVFSVAACVIGVALLTGSYYLSRVDDTQISAVKQQVRQFVGGPYGLPVKKTVEQSLSYHYEIYSGYEPIFVNRDSESEEIITEAIQK